MKTPTLVVLAAGMGSRFGGLKQISPLGPNGEIIIDYSLHDAKAAGFSDVVFVIKREIFDVFSETVGKRAEKIMNVTYAFQEIDMLPDWFNPPADRIKPWGTAHAVICAAPYIKGNFGIINADDFYGADCYVKLYNFLSKNTEKEPMELCMVAFELKNTMTENGTVSRGICTVENNMLKDVTESEKIEKNGENGRCHQNGEYCEIDGHTPVSMNVWGFSHSMLSYMEGLFDTFLKSDMTDKQKGEFYLPTAVDTAIKAGKATVEVLSSKDKWYGVTYKEDAQVVSDELKKMHSEGKYSTLA